MEIEREREKLITCSKLLHCPNAGQYSYLVYNEEDMGKIEYNKSLCSKSIFYKSTNPDVPSIVLIKCHSVTYYD